MPGDWQAAAELNQHLLRDVYLLGPSVIPKEGEVRHLCGDIHVTYPMQQGTVRGMLSTWNRGQ